MDFKGIPPVNGSGKSPGAGGFGSGRQGHGVVSRQNADGAGTGGGQRDAFYGSDEYRLDPKTGTMMDLQSLIARMQESNKRMKETLRQCASSTPQTKPDEPPTEEAEPERLQERRKGPDRRRGADRRAASGIYRGPDRRKNQERRSKVVRIVPSTLGCTVNEAVQRLMKVDIRIDGISHEHSDAVPLGRVIKQASTPDGVRLVVSDGPQG